jgi:hypothetical protein
MPADLQLIINVSEPVPAARRVVSVTNRTMLSLAPLIAGNTLSCEVYLIDSTGAYLAVSGSGSVSPRVLISRPGEATPFVTVLPAAFTPVANGWTFPLALNTTELLAALPGSTPYGAFEFEFGYTDGSGLWRSLYRNAVAILNRLYVPAGPTPASGDTFLTNLQVFRGHVRHFPAVTKLTGGTSDALDGQATLGDLVKAGDHVLVWLPGTKDLLMYQAVAGNAGSDTPFAVRADDQPTALYYALRQHLGRDGRPVVWNSTHSAYHALAATGAAGLETLGLGAAFTIPLT